ncbi:DGQHR domain-containing protein [Mesorhizobium sp.]|uniref:DGQHR domain-containing protein n=1 Tax=Mesorhizobium sp. TaxID=1871066 RepID=UPI000FE52C97|nr:DGQHR domain-containing protein [Mesorhizobium sp.]RWP51057.1 MAG: DGQHR domain-containing protein [Mesorhizobium sp.]
MASKPLILPALRGFFGNWVYYSCLMPVPEIAGRVKFATEIHPNKALSELIQRTLQGPRAKHIADYLEHNDERFFNSLVLATYGGKPQWLELGNFKSDAYPDLVKDVNQTAMDNVGFLSLAGTEKIFAIDGQHRLAGIKKGLEENLDLSDEQLSIIMVGHKPGKDGMRRTRRLFTTLNKTAVPVRKNEIIALDEDDVMAIVARRMVETDARFMHPKIAVISSANVPPTNFEALTTISNLYDVLRIIFLFETGKRGDHDLRFNRPSEDRLERHYAFALDFFNQLSATFPAVKALFDTTEPQAVTRKYRGSFGGHLLFRPVGLELLTRVVTELAAREKLTFAQALGALKDLPVDLAQAPYAGVIWDPGKHIMIARGKRLARDIMKYLVGLPVGKELAAEYRESLGYEGNDNTIQLPPPIVI